MCAAVLCVQVQQFSALCGMTALIDGLTVEDMYNVI